MIKSEFPIRILPNFESQKPQFIFKKNSKMKKSILFILTALVAVSSVFISSCKKDDNNAKTTSSGGITATIDGVSWKTAVDSASGSILSGKINITGLASDGSYITFTLLDTVDGTYNISDPTVGAGVFRKSASAVETYDSNFGPTSNSLTITVNRTNKTFSGTFQFTAYDANGGSFTPIVVTNGVFTNVPYTNNVTFVGNNSFTVNVDGTPYVPTLIVGSKNSITGTSRISITASDNAVGKAVGITLPAAIAPGTYTFDGIDVTGQYNPSSSLFYSANSAGSSLVITQNNVTNKKIVGTFHFMATPFTGTASADLTSGAFTIYY